eukprot:SAG31_NODE_27169_length_430_cov_0.933535_1_plen_67_part_01
MTRLEVAHYAHILENRSARRDEKSRSTIALLGHEVPFADGRNACPLLAEILLEILNVKLRPSLVIRK